MSEQYKDFLFAPLDIDLYLERVAGGNETEVYCTDDRRYVVKVKSEEVEQADSPLHEAWIMRQASDEFAEAIGPKYSIPSYYILSENNHQQIQPVIIQPYFQDAVPLFDIDYGKLSRQERQQIAGQLQEIIKRGVSSYLKRGRMPDIYGRSSANKDARKEANGWLMLPQRLWGFLVKRNLLRAHNLMLTPERQIILVDYDPVKQSKLYQFVYYNVRLALFLREIVLIWLMVQFGYVPRA